MRGVYSAAMNALTASTDTTPKRGYSATKGQLLNRLRRIEGQVRGIQTMVDEDRWCPDILQQIAAIQSALDKVALGLTEGHVQVCMAEGTDEKRRAEMTTELMQALGRIVR
jgi:CsoR family transcriptional regulator, copper-sensing transcriptional repressor